LRWCQSSRRLSDSPTSAWRCLHKLCCFLYCFLLSQQPREEVAQLAPPKDLCLLRREHYFYLMRKIEICTVLFLIFVTTAMAYAVTEAGSVTVQNRQVIKAIEIRGNRRVPSDRILSELQTKSGDVIDVGKVSRDIRAMYSLGYFDDVQFETDSTPDGAILIFSVREKPLIRAIEYKGVRSMTAGEIQERLALTQKALTLDSPYSLANATETASALKSLFAS